MGFDDKRVGAAEARLSELILEYNFLHSGVGQDGLVWSCVLKSGIKPSAVYEE